MPATGAGNGVDHLTKLNTDLRILFLDIECSMAKFYGYGIFDQNIPISHIIEHPRMIAFTAKWYGKSKVHAFSEYHQSRDEMLQEMHALLDEADVVIGYNSKNFDIKWINSEFAVEGMKPPSPYKQIDIMQEAKRNFRLISRKLDYLAERILGDNKIDYSMAKMWVIVDNPDTDEATRKREWNAMMKYAKKDTLLLEPLFEELLPWIKIPHPASSLDGLRCRKCGSESLRPNGSTLTAEGRYRKYLCENCGGHTRGTKREAIGETREIS